MIAALLVGLLLGFLVAIPPTGATPLLVIRRAFQGEPRRGAAIALGAALGNQPYVWLGVLGYGWMLQAYPTAAALLDLFAGALLGALGVWVLRTPVTDVPPPRERKRVGDFGKGLLIGILNPTRLLTWAVAASFAWSMLGEVRGPARFVLPPAMGAGELVWYFGLLAGWQRWGGETSVTLRQRAMRVMAVLAFAVSAWLLWRGISALVR